MTQPEEMTGDDAAYLLEKLDELVEAVEQYVDPDPNRHVDDNLWDDWGKAYNVLREYGLRPPAKYFKKVTEYNAN